MKVQNLSITHFMAIGHVETLPLNDKGLVLIQGENLDDTSQQSNGAGKSSIADALCWGLYGETARQESGDAVINRTAGKGTEVSLELLDETGALYRISRYRKHRHYKNQLRLEHLANGVWQDLTKGSDKLTQALVDRVVGCSREVFTNAIYLGQEAMPDLPGMTDRNLKLLVEEAAGIDQLQRAYEIARTRLSRCKVEVGELTAQAQALVNAITTFSANVSAAEQDRDAWIRQQQTAIQAAIQQHCNALAAFDAGMGDYLEARIRSLDDQAAVIRGKIAASDAERQQERVLAKAHREAELTYAGIQQKLRDEQTKAQQLTHSLEHISDQVGTTCSQCGHVIEPQDLETSRAAAQRAVEAQLEKILLLEDQKRSAQQTLEQVEKSLRGFREHMTDVSEQSAALGMLEQQRQKTQSEQRAWEQQANHLKTLEERIVQLKSAQNPHDAAIHRAREQLAQARTRQEALITTLDTAQRHLTLAEEAVRVFSPAGVRAHILDNVTPYLNARTAHYLSTLTDGNVTAVWSTIALTAKGELRERFSIDVVSATGGETFKSLSGGEKRKVRLATAMALQDLVASRASKPIKLFMADEIDQALDNAGLERLMFLLEEKSHDKGTVLVISHTDLRDWIRNSITIIKKNGQATVDAAYAT
jgi:DNA repair exonuclease SbcCD ATPase subunit